MSSNERIFVQAIRSYCARHGIAIDVRADGWLIAMHRGGTRRFAFGYDIGLNSAIAHRLANDKSATSEVLALAGVPSVAHHLFLNPKLGEHVAGQRWWEAMLRLLMQHPQGLVAKPNEGTAGRSVIKVTSSAELEGAVSEIFAMSLGLVIAPYVEIEDEVRIILLDETPMVVYGKERPSVTGDGVQTLRELAGAMPKVKLDELDARELNVVVPKGERRFLTWRHNLDAGAKPVLIADGEVRATCAKLAIDAARAIGITFASIDLVRVDGAWKVLEINSGVMMEALGKLHPGLVQATYDAALDRVFGSEH
ncbi:RimK-like protein [Bradyrhizobium sp. CB82]|uniref:ATP-grasp domain-containing protein n=1 Tax=Bradyrhizobium sp. CB82 TaxID=3039159 RepID=UPI0024B2505B|nr:RimK-like protein [Bradyrhizobium sp. CB82]WFU45346.1 RimK-like protein [Bradyrhizobium sp. CB82]